MSRLHGLRGLHHLSNAHAQARGAFFFFNDTATTEIYTLSLHDALPIYAGDAAHGVVEREQALVLDLLAREHAEDRKSTRLNSSHTVISYAVFCLKKKKEKRW